MSKVFRVIFILLVLAALFIPLIIAMRYVAIAQIYSYFVNSLASLLGINLYLIRVLVALAMIPFFYAIKLFFSVNSNKRRMGSALMTALMVFYNIGLYFATRGVKFSIKGDPLQWCAVTGKGVRCFDRGGFDPESGRPLFQRTPEVSARLDLIESGSLQLVDPAKVQQWFNPYTHDPVLWYYEAPDGEFEFYNQPTNHPFTNEVLRPVTAEVHSRWRERTKAAAMSTHGTPAAPASAHKSASSTDAGVGGTAGSRSPSPNVDPREQRRAALNGLLNSVNLAQGKRNIAILIDTPNTNSGFAPDQALYGHLNRDKVNLITNLFRRDVIARGYFSDLYDGNKDMLQVAAASKVDYIILGRMQYSFKKAGQVDNDLVSCEITLNCKVVNQAGDVTGGNSFRVLGPGFSESAAIERGIELLSAQFSDRILKSIQ